MGNINWGDPINYAVRFYGNNSNDNVDIDEYFGSKYLPKRHRCELKNIYLNLIDDTGAQCHYAVWKCRKDYEIYRFIG